MKIIKIYGMLRFQWAESGSRSGYESSPNRASGFLSTLAAIWLHLALVWDVGAWWGGVPGPPHVEMCVTHHYPLRLMHAFVHTQDTHTDTRNTQHGGRAGTSKAKGADKVQSRAKVTEK